MGAGRREPSPCLRTSQTQRQNKDARAPQPDPAEAGALPELTPMPGFLAFPVLRLHSLAGFSPEHVPKRQPRNPDGVCSCLGPSLMIIILLDRGLANCSPWAKSGPQPVFINTVLLELSQTYSFLYPLGLAASALEWQGRVC